MKVALVYDRINKWGGAERVLLTLHEMFPKAPLYTSVYNPQTAKWAKVFPEIKTSFLQNIPLAKKNHEYFALLMPLAFESFDFSDYDLAISVTSEAAKGIITKPGTKHICYCLTPTRYLWSQKNEYIKSAFIKDLYRPLTSYLRKWDKLASQRPDTMVAISSAVRDRIIKYYDRESEIVYPPVNIEKFQAPNTKSQTNSKFKNKNTKQNDYFLVVSRLVNYKKVDLVISVFNKLGHPLVIIGTGREERRLRRMANRNIVFVNNLTDKELASYYQNARALIFPQEEDFGLVAVEAQAAGTPVIAFRSGGALDIVIDSKTGIFFDKQSENDLRSAITRFENTHFDCNKSQTNAGRFSKDKFKREFLKIANKYK